MSLIDIIIIILSVVAVIGVIYFQIKNKKKGTNCCGGDCSKCNIKHQ